MTSSGRKRHYDTALFPNFHLYLAILFQAAKIRLNPKISPDPFFFFIWPAEYFIFFSRFLCERLLQRDSPRSSERRTVAGKNGTHFAHHSSHTAHRVSLPRECFAIDQFQSSGGWGGKPVFCFRMKGSAIYGSGAKFCSICLQVLSLWPSAEYLQAIF